MNFSGLYEMQGMLFSLMLLGALLKRMGIISHEGKKVLGDLVIYVTLPCSIIKSFEMEFSTEILKSSAEILLVSCAIQAGCYLLNMFLYRGVESRQKKVLMYATMTSNGGILGNPIAEGIFGSMGLFYASIYLIPVRTMMWSLGMSYFTECPDRKTLVKKVATHPCILAVAVGFVLLFTQYQPGGFVGATINSLNNANTAMSMLFVGTVLAEADIKKMISPLIMYYSFIRLALIPALVWAGCRLFGCESLITGVSVVLAGMPAASVSTILASKYGGDAAFATQCVVFTTVLSMATVPLWCMALA